MIFQDNRTGPIISLSSDLQPSPIVDEASSTITYIGYANLGVSENSDGWKIMRISKIGTVTLTEYADGDMLYDNIWNQRTSLNYFR